MYYKILKYTFSSWICLLLVHVSISAQELSENGGVTINVDNCCSDQYNELGGGQVQEYTIPNYPFFNGLRFDLRGGDGGKAKAGSSCESVGGNGATVSAVFIIGEEENQLKPGGTIRFIVGKHGDDDSVGGSAYSAGGGGGGSAVLYRPTNNVDWEILAVAGGGGGAFQGNVLGGCVDSQKGQGGRGSVSGGGGAGNNAGSGGSNGDGGGLGVGGSLDASGGGGGAYSGGGGSSLADGGSQGFYNGGSGGIVSSESTEGSGGWGFGGGGSAYGAAGGGGGFSGGGGGGKHDNGGGGGSYVNPNYAYLSEKNDGGASGGTDHGYITYEFKDYCVTGIDWIEESVGFCAGESPAALISTHLVNPDGCNVLYYYLNGLGTTQSNTTGEFITYFPGNYTVSLLQIEDGITSWIDNKHITITISDSRPPYMKCKNTSVSMSGSSRLIVHFENQLDDGSTDNCELASLEPSTSFFTCSNIGTQTVTLTGTDAAGNTATCTSTVTVFDSGGPTPDVTNLPTLSDACSVTVTSIPTATDGCEGSGFVATTTDPLTYTEQGTYSITWRYEDSNGNTSTQTQSIIVDDTSSPVVSCPSDIIVDAEENSCSAIVSYIGSVVDDCESEVEAVTYTGNSSNVPEGEDRLLLVQVCHFDEVTSATYNGNPMALAVRQVANIAGSCEIWYIALGTGPAISASAQVSGTSWPNSIKYTSFEHVNQNIPFGDIATGKHKNELQVNTRLKDVIYEGFMRRDGNSINPRSGQTEVFDNAFNSSSSRCWGGYLVASGGTETVKVNTNNGAHVALVLQANHTTQFSYSIDPESTFQIGTAQVTVTATDKGNNSSSCTFNITVNDMAPPTISCPDNITVNADAGLCTALVNYNVSSNDNCSNEVIELSTGLPSGSNFPVGVTTNTLVVTDAGGLTANCAFQVTVNDIELPAANCQNTTLQLGGDGNASLATADIDDNSMDNCNTIASIELDQTDFNCASIGSNAVILTVIDNYDNSSTCQAIVLVEDNVSPTAFCEDKTIQLDNNGSASILPETVGNGSNDACGIGSMSLDQDNFSCSTGSTLVTLMVTDNNGNTNQCTATITVEDAIVPSASCNDITINLVDRNTFDLSVAQIDLIAQGSFDNCTTLTPTITNGTTNYDCDDRGQSFEVTLTVTDGSNLTNTCIATITIADPNNVCNDPPVAVCQNITLTADSNCEVMVEAGAFDGGSFDPDDDLLYFAMNHDSYFTLGTHEITLTVSDGEFTSSCTAEVTVEDLSTPVISCPGDLSLNTDPGSCSSTFTVPLPDASDNCEVSVLRYRYRLVDELGNNLTGEGWSSWSTSTTETLGIGHWKVQWQAKDPSNNQKKCAFLIEVSDNEVPTVVCQEKTVYLQSDGTYSLTENDVLDWEQSSDNCSMLNISQIETPLVNCDDEGLLIPVLVTVEDASENTSQCTALIQVEKSNALPDPWSNSEIGNATGNATYDPCEDIFTLEATGFSLPNSDAEEFIGQEICGDVTFVAHISSFSGLGWAGISLRESTAPGAKKIELKTQLGNYLRRSFRTITNGYQLESQILRPGGHSWLKLVRSGNNFIGYSSLNGSNWQMAFSTTIALNNCIYLGMRVQSVNANSTTTVQFDQLSINGLLVQPLATTKPTMAPDNQAKVNRNLDFSIYPNPAREEANLDLTQFLGENLRIRIYNSDGQAVMQSEAEGLQHNVKQLNIGNLPAGIYVIEIQTAIQRITRKLVKTDL